jgi:hypothetical protein
MTAISNKVVQALEKLETKDGKLDPETVVAAAENVKSPLHHLFTWDDSEAARQWRLEQARSIIRLVRIEVKIQDRNIRTIAYVHDPEMDITSKDADGDATTIRRMGYVSTLKLARTDARTMLVTELCQVGALLDRVITLAELKHAVAPALAGQLIAIRRHIQTLSDAI